MLSIVYRAGLSLTTAMTKLYKPMTLVNREISVETRSTRADDTAANSQLESFCYYIDPL